MPAYRYVLQVTAKALRVGISLNDIPVVLIFPGEADTPIDVPINHELVNGENTILVTIHFGLTPATERNIWKVDTLKTGYSGNAILKIDLVLYQIDGSIAVSPPAAWTMDWSGEALPVPTVLQRSFVIHDTFAVWSWRRSLPVVELPASIRNQAWSFLSSLHTALTNGKIDEIVAQSDLKCRELTAAYGVSAQPLLSGLRQALTEHAGNEEWILDPLDRSILSLRVVGQGRLIECRQTNWDHALIFRHKANKLETFFLPVMIGWLADRWQVLH